MGLKDLLRRGSPLPHRPAVPVESQRVTTIIGSRQHLSTVTCANRSCLPVSRRTTKLSCPIPLGPKWVAARHGAIWSRLRKSVGLSAIARTPVSRTKRSFLILSPNGSSIHDGPPSESNILPPAHTADPYGCHPVGDDVGSVLGTPPQPQLRESPEVPRALWHWA
jgi:hypothetical protein